ncbi:MAG: trypsin-like peptidase domain-containing protein [Nitrospirae bacterium]|nr:trypsin-like peptidase domain-containing protein [Nitrospirota bacterium]
MVGEIARIGTWLLLGLFLAPVTACEKAADRPLAREAVVSDAPGQGAERQTVSAVENLMPRTAFVRIAKTLAPTVVHLKTVQELREGWNPFHRKPNEWLFEGFIKRLLGWSKEIMMKQEGVGSGFLIHPAGYVLTNDHVVKHANEIHAVLSDGREFPARVIGQDSRADLALLQLVGEGPFPSADLGDSDRLESGEWALAVGSPLGLAQTFTVGVISATGRSHLGITSRENFIQTDASINYGNSGGPLVNIDAEVIGINTAIMPTGHGIGFAIPINMARQFVEEVLKRRPVETAWLGLQVWSVPLEQRIRDGVSVQSVQWESPAWRSGLRPADRILQVDGMDMTDVGRLQRIIADGGVGAEWALTVWRDGRIEEIKVRSEDRPARVFP